MIIATVCYVHWGVKIVLKCTVCQNKTRASNKGLIRMDKQRVGGRDKMAKTEPPRRASVATEPESLFYFWGPAKLAVEASELQGKLNIILWMSVWGSTILEYPFDICWVFSVSKPGVILCGIAGRQTKIRDTPRLGSVVIWFCAWMTLIFSVVINIITELRDDKALAIAVACCYTISSRIFPPLMKGCTFR